MSAMYTPKKFSPSILKRCKGVIQQLQDELTRVNGINAQRQQLIEQLTKDNEAVSSSNRQFQKAASELRQVNQMLQAEVEHLRAGEKQRGQEVREMDLKIIKTEEQLKEARRELAGKEKEVEMAYAELQQLRLTAERDREDRKKLDQQWQLTLEEVAARINTIEFDLKNEQDQKKRLQVQLQQAALQNQQILRTQPIHPICNCQQAIQEIYSINKELQRKYHELELVFSPPKKISSQNLSSQKRASSIDTRGTAKSTTKISASTSRPRINNSAYLSKEYYKDVNHNTTPAGNILRSHIRPFQELNEPSYKHNTHKLPNSARKPFFAEQNFSNPTPPPPGIAARLDPSKIQKTLRDLESKLQRMVRRAEHDSSDSFME